LEKISVAPFDEPIVRFLNQFAQVNPAFDRLVLDIADSAVLKGGVFMAYFWWLWAKSDKDTISRQNTIVVSFAGALLAVAISRILQRLLPFHDRIVHSAGFVLPTGVDPKALSDWSSFPSDHAALFFALSTAIWFQSRRLGFLAGLWTTFVICGAVLGVAIMAGTHFWAASARWPARIVDWSRTHQTAFYPLAFLATYEITVLFYDLRALAEDGFHVLRSVMPASV
jgi:undecaprenyl-diphosphatase